MIHHRSSSRYGPDSFRHHRVLDWPAISINEDPDSVQHHFSNFHLFPFFFSGCLSFGFTPSVFPIHCPSHLCPLVRLLPLLPPSPSNHHPSPPSYSSRRRCIHLLTRRLAIHLFPRTIFHPHEQQPTAIPRCRLNASSPSSPLLFSPSAWSLLP
jgi:hypothetical protein